MPRQRSVSSGGDAARAYEHKEHSALLRPDVGLQAQFKKKLPPATYRYDRTLDPQMSWDINADREVAESLIERIRRAETLDEARAAAEQLKGMSSPFLNWAGKAERSDYTVPTLPLFVHERLSTRAILESVRLRKRQLDLFADPQLEIADRILRAYEHKTGWVNRLVLGDSLQVMNSLLRYEGLGGQVQMIYVDPPYGVEFGSNFQPFVRKRNVKHNADEDLTREPEMVQAYRDTWELGLHSYLTYLRDRLRLAWELLHPTGSVFVQISDENLHHVREVLDEVFGASSFVVTFAVKKKGSQKSSLIDPVNDYVVWYTKTPRAEAGDHGIKFRQLFQRRELDGQTLAEYRMVELRDGREFRVSEVPDPSGHLRDYTLNPRQLLRDHPGARLYRSNPLTSGGVRKNQSVPYTFKDRTYHPGAGNCWKTTVVTDDGSKPGMDRLAEAGRLLAGEGQLRFKSYLDDFGFTALSNWWDGLGGASDPQYVVQTNEEIIARCILMTTDPGDLVLDPTCGSGTTAYVAEQWGRRWIAVDTSRVPLALARQRLLTATFPYYELRDERAGVSGGFRYERKRNARGEEVGGIVPHVTLESIAHGEKPKEEVLVDRPNVDRSVVRVSGPFVVEATIPTPVDLEEPSEGVPAERSSPPTVGNGSVTSAADHYTRMLEALRLSPVLRLPGNRTVTFKGVRAPAHALSLHAEAVVEGNGDKPVAFVFGPENGAVTEQLVFQAIQEAYAKRYSHLYVIGFACEDAAANLVKKATGWGIPATFVHATMDLAMGDLLKTSRASQVFSVAGEPDVRLIRLRRKSDDGQLLYRVELLGLDVFDPVTMETDHHRGDDVPAWFLDTDYNDLSFLVCQAFFPRTGAWDNLKRALKGVYDESLWEHLAGTVSEPFVAGESGRVAVKVIDDRGNELMVVRGLTEAEAER